MGRNPTKCVGHESNRVGHGLLNEYKNITGISFGSFRVALMGKLSRVATEVFGTMIEPKSIIKIDN